MKKYCLSILALIACFAIGCDKQGDEVNLTAPTIVLEKGEATATTLSFTVTTTDATEAAYMVVNDGEQLPTLDAILDEGVAIDGDNATVTVKNLQPQTKYQIVAAAKNSAKVAGSNTLYMSTLEQGKLEVTAEIVSLDHESMSFRINTANADRVAYLVLYASKDAPEANYVLLNGEDIPADSREAVVVTGLENAKEYQLLVAAEGLGQKVLAEPILFTTDDDPSNVIKHNYTRAKGSKYGSNYFVMLSYEDANEEDNMAYNDKTLSLDIYGDPDKDYLPAGTYEVKESTTAPCLSSYYSTYGYNERVKFKSGQAVVSIDPETKAYTFDVDIFLVDGRHLQATYTGDLMGMPVIDKVTVATTFTAASATTADNGKNWALTMRDGDGNEARLNLTNAYQAPYIAKNSYTISSSAEEFSVKALFAKLLATEAGEFDSTTSTFKVAGENGGEFKFATGTLTVDIDWVSKRYLISFYGTLENGYIIESEYTGAIEGCSLEPSTEVIEVVMDMATARSYDSDTNWYLTFTKTENEVETYRLILDAYCSASPFLPAGVYKLGVTSGGYLDSSSTSLNVAGEQQYYFTEATATVDVDTKAKSYTFNITARIEDGRTFKISYVGEVDGMEIIETEEPPLEVEWAYFGAKKWYSDNWSFNIKDAEEQYVIELDMRVGDSTLNYIPSGTYTFGESGQYIDPYYSKFNGNKSSFSEATLILDYDAEAKTYDVAFELTLNDGRKLNGEYSGVVDGLPLPVEEEEEEEEVDTTIYVTWNQFSAVKGSEGNWMLTVKDSESQYTLGFDIYTDDSTLNYIPSGTYTLGSYGVRLDYVNSTFNGATSIYSNATLTLVYDSANKTYDVSLEATLTDGRKLNGTYNGVIEGVPTAVEEEEEEEEPGTEVDPSAISWTSFAAKHWYSDNWEISIKDSTNTYTIVLDMRVGDSSLNYIPSGTYTFGDSGQYLNAHYCKFNGVPDAFSAAELVVVYNDAAQTYELTFDVTLSENGTNYKGSYNGKLEGSPKQ